MTLKITPDESRVVERGSVIQTRCDKGSITEEAIAQRAKADNLASGDNVRVQCQSFDRSTVLYQRDYLVYTRRTEMKTHEANDRDIRQFEDVTYGVEPVGEWFETKAGKASREATEAAAKKLVESTETKTEKKKAA